MDLEKVALTAVIIVLISIITVMAIFNLLSQNKQGFTELYFVGNLPKAAEIGKEYNFSFAIHNMENKETTYMYEIYANAKEIEQGSVIVDNGRIKTISKSLILNKEEKTKISVYLLNKDQEIHFWVNAK